MMAAGCEKHWQLMQADNTDTQWPRWEVFQQQSPNQPFRNAGSVHAPDAELALELARDVFTRRPECADYFVILASQIYARTAEELAAKPDELSSAVETAVEPQPYLVFCKQSQRSAETYVVQVGEVEARNPLEALAQALEKYGDLNAFVWWVCPASAICRIDSDEAQSLFAQMHSKPYRQPQYYKVVAEMQRLKSKSS